MRPLSRDRYCSWSGTTLTDVDRSRITFKPVVRVIEGHEFRTEFRFITCRRCGRELRVQRHPSSARCFIFPRHKEVA